MVTTTVEITRPIGEVFEYFSDVENAPDWSVEVVEVTHDGPIGLGATGRDVRMMGKRQITMPWTVTEYEPPYRAVFEYTEPFPTNMTFQFDPTESGTRVTCAMVMKPTGFWKLLSPLMAREGAKADRAQFARAKEILESRFT